MRSLLRHLVGALCALLGLGIFAWDVRVDGTIDLTTGIVAGALAFVGGFLIDAAAMQRVVAFLGTTIRSLLGAKKAGEAGDEAAPPPPAREAA